MSDFQRDQFLKSSHTGTAVSVSCLVSKRSQGIGDFSDLASFGEWCAEAGLDLIQILPINDTGTMASPYSALSAFALHPIYADLFLIPGIESKVSEIQAFQEKAQSWERVNYSECLSFKTKILKDVFEEQKTSIEVDLGLSSWIQDNNWLRIYSAYLILREDQNLLPWYAWGAEIRECSQELVENTIASNQERFLFHAWTQWNLEKQLSGLRNRLEDLEVFLKGDIPILMNDDSADVWAHPELFDMSKRAGAPPDMFVTTGQHWGFPTYNWKEMASQQYGWWISRLKQAEKFYHLYRIDHVLGFFRIWSIPEKESTGTLGIYEPIEHPSREELEAIGLDFNQIAELTSANIFSHKSVGEDPKEQFSEKHFESSTVGDLSNEEALDAYRDWSLIPIGDEQFAFTWYFQNATAFKDLPLDLAEKLVSLKEMKDEKSEKTWEEQGRRLLGVLKASTNMLACAEDLGVVPDCVPKVLADLEILSLKIERWVPNPKSTKDPILHPKFYPKLSVCTTSVHDTDTLRGWWEKEDPKTRSSYFKSLNLAKNENELFSPVIGRAILTRQMESNSLVLAIPIQDYFSLSEKYYLVSPEDERVNIPGTVTDFNWSYKLPFFLEDVRSDENLRMAIQNLVSIRGHEEVKTEP